MKSPGDQRVDLVTGAAPRTPRVAPGAMGRTPSGLAVCGGVPMAFPGQGKGRGTGPAQNYEANLQRGCRGGRGGRFSC